MMLTNEQQEAVDCRENRILSSCPGSGKTRTIISKILSCIEESKDTTRKIGCITYTNAAVNEIESRLRSFETGEEHLLYEINTIHSFCLNNILRPYYHLIAEIPKGFNILSIDSNWYITTVQELIRKYDLAPWLFEAFSSIHHSKDNSIKVPNGLPTIAAEEFLELCITNSYLTFGEIIYFSYMLLCENPFIARAISSRFAWLMVDEFQDTTDLQVEILSLISSYGRTKFFIVGDQNQSIYGFAGADPNLMNHMAGKINAKTDISLNGNFRCSSKIVNLAEKICPRNVPMKALGENRNFPVEPKYIHANNLGEAILGYFLPEVERLGIDFGKTAILAPQWPALFQLSKKLRDRSLPIIGPGSRPYKRSYVFSQFAEASAAYVYSKDSVSSIACQRALFFLILNLTGEASWKIYSYIGKTYLCFLLNKASAISEGNNAVSWLNMFGKVCSELLYKFELINDSEKSILISSVDGMIESIKKNVQDWVNMPIEALGIFAKPNECINLMTMHSSKGLEFDAVAIIDFQDGKIPHFSSFNDKSALDEGKRLTYVATTRAKKFLVFCSDKSDTRNPPSRFLSKDCLGFV